MNNIFNNFVFEPILEILSWIYNNIAFNDLGLAIIFLTILIRVILFPFFLKSSKDQALIKKIQPQVEKIKKNHKNNKEKQAEELMNLYKNHKLNPFSGFVLLMIQLPIFFGLFKIFKNPEIITQNFANHTLFNLIDLVNVSIILVLIASVIQYIQAKTTMSINKTSDSKNNSMAKFGNLMIYFMPFMSFMILSRLPSALAVYWIVSAIFSIIQSFIVNKKISKIDFTKTKNSLEYKESLN
jgi:YidC/Oxa1 family membrane protein insertase